MGLLQRITSPLRSKADATTTSDRPAQWFLDWALGETSRAGVTVNVRSALALAAVYACVRVRSEDIGKLPCLLYRRLAGGGKMRANDHPYYRLIRERPNPRMTALEFKQFLQLQLDLRGNGFALKEFDGRGRVTALWPWPSDCVEVLTTPDRRDLFYRFNFPAAGSETFPADSVLHLRGMSLDGLVGLSPIAYHRETIGLAIAARDYGASFFGNSAQPRGGIKLPTMIGADAANALRASWEARHKGIENANRLAIFDGGMEWVPTAINNVDSQYIETRGLQNADIWRIYRMPPHKVADLDKATFSNIEQQALEYVTDCLMAEAVRWEQTLARDLLTEDEQQEYFFEFLLDGLVRGDLQSRYAAYGLARQWGFFNVDEIRERENMNPLPDGKGKIYLQPMNMIEAGTTPPSEGSAKALLALATILAAHEEQTENAKTPPL
jgi:HK97 family phage portal protein